MEQVSLTKVTKETTFTLKKKTSLQISVVNEQWRSTSNSRLTRFKEPGPDR